MLFFIFKKKNSQRIFPIFCPKKPGSESVSGTEPGSVSGFTSNAGYESRFSESGFKTLPISNASRHNGSKPAFLTFLITKNERLEFSNNCMSLICNRFLFYSLVLFHEGLPSSVRRLQLSRKNTQLIIK